MRWIPPSSSPLYDLSDAAKWKPLTAEVSFLIARGPPCWRLVPFFFFFLYIKPAKIHSCQIKGVWGERACIVYTVHYRGSFKLGQKSFRTASKKGS